MMSSTDTRTDEQLAAALVLWTERTNDALARGCRDLIAGCRRNLRAVEREIRNREEN